jgi:hypothetical protein
MTERLHRQDPYLLEFDPTVVARREHPGRPAVVLDRTAGHTPREVRPLGFDCLGFAASCRVPLLSATAPPRHRQVRLSL